MKTSEIIERVKVGESIYLNDDCMNHLGGFPENFVNLAIVDPQTGQGEDVKSNHSRGKLAKATRFKPKNWDNRPPTKKYFDHLFRVSVNQIIWCAAHFQNKINKVSAAWIFWDKKNGSNDFGDGELAYCSIGNAIRKFEFTWAGMRQGDMKNKEVRIHTCQKPKQIYRWQCKNYAKPGDIILDSHVGSGNSLAVYEELGFQYVAFEKDADYYKDSLENIKKHKAFFKSRKPEELTENTQLSIYDEL